MRLMAKIAKEWMKRMGIVHTQYIIARHHDTRHPHCHIVYNLVGNEGQIISDSNERYRSARICKALTEEYGLYIARKNSKEQNLDRLRSHQRQKAQLRAAVMDARQESSDWNSFLNALSRRNVSVQATTDRAGDKVVGLSFGIEDAHCSGYRLDPSLSYPHFVIAFGQALEEILFQPHAQSLDCSGSPVNNQGWRNRDDEEAKKNRKGSSDLSTLKTKKKMKEDIIAANISGLRSDIQSLAKQIAAWSRSFAQQATPGSPNADRREAVGSSNC